MFLQLRLSKGGLGKSIYFWNIGARAHTFFDSYGHSSIFKKRNEAPSITTSSEAGWGIPAAQLGGGAEISTSLQSGMRWVSVLLF